MLVVLALLVPAYPCVFVPQSESLFALTGPTCAGSAGQIQTTGFHVVTDESRELSDSFERCPGCVSVIGNVTAPAPAIGTPATHTVFEVWSFIPASISNDYPPGRPRDPPGILQAV